MGLGNSGSGSAEGNIGKSNSGDSQSDFASGAADSSIEEALFSDSLGFSSNDLTGAKADLAMASDSSSLVQSLDDAGQSENRGSDSNIAQISIQNQEGSKTASIDDSGIQEVSVAANMESMLPDVSFEIENSQDSQIAKSGEIVDRSENVPQIETPNDSNFMDRIASTSSAAYGHLLTLEDRLSSSETA